jgi:hypothetical protein
MITLRSVLALSLAVAGAAADVARAEAAGEADPPKAGSGAPSQEPPKPATEGALPNPDAASGNQPPKTEQTVHETAAAPAKPLLTEQNAKLAAALEALADAVERERDAARATKEAEKRKAEAETETKAAKTELEAEKAKQEAAKNAAEKAAAVQAAEDAQKRLEKAQADANEAKTQAQKANEAKSKAEADRKEANDKLEREIKARKIAASQSAVDAAKAEAEEKEGDEEVDLRSGTVRYGVTTTLLRLQSSRRASDPARARDYQLGIEKLPLDLGFQFSYRPKQSPYRLKTKDGAGFQMISVGGMLSVTMNPRIASQAEVILGFVLSFFDESVSLGLGFDLYRGVPARGSEGAGSDTAPTGLFGWACSKRGEITPENFSLLLTFNVSKIAGSVGGEK